MISSELSKARTETPISARPKCPVVYEARSLEELERLRPEWFTLWQQCPDSTPFQSPAWLIGWWKHLGQGQLWVLELRQGDRLCGLAPFYLHQSDSRAPRELRFLGNAISDYRDILIDRACRTEGLNALSRHLEANDSEWDLMDLQQLCFGSSALRLPIPSHWRSRTSKQEVCPVLRLPVHVKGLSEILPRSTFSKLAYYRRRLAKLPNTTFELADRETFPGFFERFLYLHRARWTQRGQTGLLAHPQLESFHQEAASAFLHDGILRLYAFRCEGTIVASLYVFSHRTRVFFYLSGFDPAVASLSPGMLLIGHAIEQAIREGCETFDFLRGNEAYKYLWGAKDEINYRRIVQRRV